MPSSYSTSHPNFHALFLSFFCFVYWMKTDLKENKNVNFLQYKSVFFTLSLWLLCVILCSHKTFFVIISENLLHFYILKMSESISVYFCIYLLRAKCYFERSFNLKLPYRYYRRREFKLYNFGLLKLIVKILQTQGVIIEKSICFYIIDYQNVNI